MLAGFDLKHLFYFPIENSEARKNFLIGGLLILASLIIPILPYLIALGYAMRIMRQVIAGEQPRMIAWDDWEGMLKDGLKLFGVRFVYSLPLLLVLLPVMLVFLVTPFLAAVLENENIFFLSFLVFPVFIICLLPFSLVFALIIPAPEAHVTATQEFSAGFRVKEWWPIFRKNIGGFLVAFLVIYGAGIVVSIAFQIIFLTIILACLTPILLPGFSFYLLLVQQVLFAQAYREGREKFASSPLPAA
ncbi:MAG: hypothetical protein Fur0016_06740 [Anaerolineales bacterium]